MHSKEAAQDAIAATLHGQPAGKPPQFPFDGAKRIAGAIMDFLPPPSPVSVQGWEVDQPRPASTVNKFSATADEIGRNAVEIHDNVLLLRPAD